VNHSRGLPPAPGEPGGSQEPIPSMRCVPEQRSVGAAGAGVLDGAGGVSEALDHVGFEWRQAGQVGCVAVTQQGAGLGG
jgi:hypothetical protein